MCAAMPERAQPNTHEVYDVTTARRERRVSGRCPNCGTAICDGELCQRDFEALVGQLVAMMGPPKPRFAPASRDRAPLAFRAARLTTAGEEGAAESRPRCPQCHGWLYVSEGRRLPDGSSEIACLTCGGRWYLWLARSSAARRRSAR